MVQDSRHANGVDGVSKGVHRWRIPDCGWNVVPCHNCCWKNGILVDIYPVLICRMLLAVEPRVLLVLVCSKWRTGPLQCGVVFCRA